MRIDTATPAMEAVASLAILNLGKFDFLAPVRMSVVGYKQTFRRPPTMSAYPPIADVGTDLA